MVSPAFRRLGPCLEANGKCSPHNMTGRHSKEIWLGQMEEGEISNCHASTRRNPGIEFVVAAAELFMINRAGPTDVFFCYPLIPVTKTRRIPLAD